MVVKNRRQENIYPLSLSQREIWFDQLMYPDIPLYNIGGYVRIDGPVDPVLFEQAVCQLVHQNDALRTILHEGDPLPVQEFPKEVRVEIPFFDFSNSHRDPVQWMKKEFDKPFELYEKLLFQYAFIKISQDCYCWFFKYHHLVADGWSILLIVQRMAAAYNNLLSISAGSCPGEQEQYTYSDFVLDDLKYLE